MPRWITIALAAMVLAAATAWVLTPASPRYSNLQPDPSLPTFHRVGAAEGYDPHNDPEAERYIEEGTEHCSFPDVPAGARLLVVSTASGLDVPSLTLGSQDDATSTAAIMVTPGDEKLYIVAISQEPVIWRLSGATERVQHLVLGQRQTGKSETGSRGASLAAATGIAADKVSFLAHHTCIPDGSDYADTHARALTKFIQRNMNRAPDMMAYQRQVSSFELPSGAIDVAAGSSLWHRIMLTLGLAEPSPEEMEEAQANAQDPLPDGVIRLQRNKVVSENGVQPYRTLPGGMGLQQLVARGVLAEESRNHYRIRQSMRFPPGMDLRNDLAFVVEKGVSQPTGDMGMVCVTMEETGVQLNPRCMG